MQKCATFFGFTVCFLFRSDRNESPRLPRRPRADPHPGPSAWKRLKENPFSLKLGIVYCPVFEFFLIYFLIYFREIIE